MNERCQYIVAGRKCKCWGIERVDGIPYCKQHAEKLRRLKEAYEQGKRAAHEGDVTS